MTKKIEMTKKIGLYIQLEKDLLDEYKLFCKRNGYNMSARLRMFIEEELKKNWKLGSY